MPETPDFDQIAVGIMNRMGLYDDVVTKLDLAEQFRQVWNARGAADIAALETSLTSQMGATASGPYVKNLDRALRSLDR